MLGNPALSLQKEHLAEHVDSKLTLLLDKMAVKLTQVLNNMEEDFVTDRLVTSKMLDSINSRPGSTPAVPIASDCADLLYKRFDGFGK